MFVYELHDVAKLLDREALEPELGRCGLGSIKSSGQSFSKVAFNAEQLPEPTTDTWRAIVKHEGDRDWEDLKMIPPNATGEEIEFRRQRFVTTLADRFTSSIAREQVHTVIHFDPRLEAFARKQSDLTQRRLTLLNDLLIPAFQKIDVLGGHRSKGGGRVKVEIDVARS
jgi:hypothetical protein